MVYKNIQILIKKIILVILVVIYYFILNIRKYFIREGSVAEVEEGVNGGALPVMEVGARVAPLIKKRVIKVKRQ